MNCPDELTLSIYADGELPGSEVRALEFHLGTCRDCGTLVESLRGENRLLARVIEEAAPLPGDLPALRPVATFPMGWAGVATVAGIAMLRVLFGLIHQVLPVGVAEWIQPFSASGRTGLIFDTIFRFAEQGSAALVVFVPLVMFSILLCGALLLISQRSELGRQTFSAGFHDQEDD